MAHFRSKNLVQYNKSSCYSFPITCSTIDSKEGCENPYYRYVDHIAIPFHDNFLTSFILPSSGPSLRQDFPSIINQKYQKQAGSYQNLIHMEGIQSTIGIQTSNTTYVDLFGLLNGKVIHPQSLHSFWILSPFRYCCLSIGITALFGKEESDFASSRMSHGVCNKYWSKVESIHFIKALQTYENTRYSPPISLPQKLVTEVSKSMQTCCDEDFFAI